MSDSDDMVVVQHSGSESHDEADDVNELSLEVIGNRINENEEEEDDSTSEREDITQSLEVVGRVKAAIQFHDDEALQQALDKVKERPLIDAAFGEKIEMLRRLKNTENYAYFHDSIDHALSQLTNVQEKAKSGKTSLNRPIEILNEVLPVFEKACSIYTEKLELSGTVNKNLNDCDVIRAQIKSCLAMDRQDVDEAKRLEKDCDKRLEEGARASKRDVEKVYEKLKEEKDADILTWFQCTREENCDKMDYLTSDFQQMKENCTEDIQLTERTMNIEIESKESACEKFKKKDTELVEQIEEELETEKELKEKLCRVQKHRQALEEERENRKIEQGRADVVHQTAENELELLLDNLKNLLAKVDTADLVLRQTRDVCNKLFDQAVQSKSTKNHDLDNLLIQSKSLRHVALVAQAVHCKNNVETQKGTVAYMNDKINSRKKKLQHALQLKLSKEVRAHQEKLQNLSIDYESSKKQQQRNDTKLVGLLEEIVELEKFLDENDAEYEGLDSAFQRFKQQEDGTDGFSMPSIS